jgi:nicotinate-nucleotide pyrophosphorylase (carboxylating)
MMQFESFNFDAFIQNALKEDVGDGDHTSLACIPSGAQGKAHLIVKEKGILAGVELSKKIFNFIDPSLKMTFFLNDGNIVKESDIAFVVHGSVHSILLAERLVLNCMQRMSGIATLTNAIVQLLKDTKTKVLDTRKTTPGMRLLEKWAVQIGGGVNHRIGLYDMILIKDNHIDFAGGIQQAITAANVYKKQHPQWRHLPIEIETRNLNELQQVLATGQIDRIMLDNFTYQNLEQAIKLVDNRYLTEASGGITIENVLEYARCGVDFVSMGALTHSVKSMDLSLKAFN